MADGARLVAGGTVTRPGILGPDGAAVAGPAPGDAETIVSGEIDLERIVRAKLVHDVAGNYNRFDVLSLVVNRAPLRALREVGEPVRPAPEPLDAGSEVDQGADSPRPDELPKCWWYSS